MSSTPAVASILAFAGVAAVLVLTPGVGTTFLMSTVVDHGRKAGYLTAIGMVVGAAIHATIAAVGIMQSIAGPQGFGVHPIYILLAIGFGSKFLAWMNDAGFWVICRLGGLTQEEKIGRAHV